VARITIFPRFFGFGVDPHPFGIVNARSLQPFHHGIKDPDKVLKWYGPLGRESGEGTCVSFKNAMRATEISKALRKADEYVLAFRNHAQEQVPRWRQQDQHCYDRMWCGPIMRNSANISTMEGLIGVNGTLYRYKFRDPGREWHNTHLKF
jgi:hypothetical protein